MPMRTRWMIVPLAGLLALAGGCEEEDTENERLADMAERTVAEQARQNERLAAQTEQIAVASKQLITAEAQARQQMLATHAGLQRDLDQQRSEISRELTGLENERRAIAAQRYREPLVAAAITTCGLTLACLLPLGLAAWILYVVSHPSCDHARLSELLVSELTAEQPLLRPPPHQLPRLESTLPKSSDSSAAPVDV